MPAGKPECRVTKLGVLAARGIRSKSCENGRTPLEECLAKLDENGLAAHNEGEWQERRVRLAAPVASRSIRIVEDSGRGSSRTDW